MTRMFSNSSPKISNSGIFVHKVILIRKILQLNKFEGFDFKYDNIISNFQLENTQIMYLWAQL